MLISTVSVCFPAHSFYLCKLDIVEVIVLDFYGGPHYVTREDYYQADPDKLSRTQFNDDINNVK